MPTIIIKFVLPKAYERPIRNKILIHCGSAHLARILIITCLCPPQQNLTIEEVIIQLISQSLYLVLRENRLDTGGSKCSVCS